MNPFDPPKRICILVLGMHRSGTSAITRVLSLLGATLPRHLIEATPTNETGYWEPASLVQINDDMLKKLSSRWDDWRAFDPTALGASLPHYRNAIRDAIAAEFADTPLFVIKDPRICRFAPFYESVLTDMGVATRFVLVHRNPVSVLASLQRRDQISTNYGALVWLRHVLDAETSTRGKDRVFVSYEQLMDNWSSVASEITNTLGIDWPIGGHQAAGPIGHHLRRDLQHHVASSVDAIPGCLVEDAVRDTYQSLLALPHVESAGGALKVLDRIKAKLDSGTPAFADSLFEEMATRERRETQNREHMQRVAAEQQGALEAFAKDNADQNARLVTLEGSYSQAELRGNQLAKALADSEARITEAAAREEALLHENTTLRCKVTELSHGHDAIHSTQQHLLGVLDAIYGSTSWRITRPLRSAKRKTVEFRTVATGALSLIRERRLTPATVAKGIRRLPRLMREGKLSSPASFAELAETLDPALVFRIQKAFDAEFYLRQNPDIATSGLDPFAHFLAQGWKENRDPSAEFSMTYYLQRYPDIARGGVNPFIHYVLHGRGEKRTALPFKRRLERMAFRPKVTAIVPNYNHARFLEQRLESILSQTYDNIDILILDDGSSDDSREVIQRYCNLHAGRMRSIFNVQNSGNVFRQWRKGVEHSESDLVWICESDDFCEPTFIEHLIPHFRDRSVNLAFGRVQFVNRSGKLQAGLDDYREGAEPGIWGESLVRPAAAWFAGGFGVNNVIANVGGCVWRRQLLPADTWAEAETYSVLGDWFLYCHLAGGGQIAYEPSSVSYFRQHGKNTSVSSFVNPSYYSEHHRLMSTLCNTWNIPSETLDRFISKVDFQYQHFGLKRKFGQLTQYLNKRDLLSIKRQRPHILLAFLGFHSGGGEVFPINLANELHDQGYLVSMLALDMSHVNQDMLKSLNPAIAVFDADMVAETGVDRFLMDAGISLIHSHMAALEVFFFEQTNLATDVPYIVTLHGSYESADLSIDLLKRITNRVTHWVYTTDRNLEPFRLASIPENKLTKIGNGMPIDETDFPKTRQELGIPEKAIVFTLVARGILRKGWRASIAAFIKLRDRHPEQQLHLLLCGDGEQANKHEHAFGSERGITFLGYQSRIHGLYRISDVAIVPTRFGGESFPLCIIQAMQVGNPVISTRVGEIERMVAPDGQAPCGIIIDPVRDTERFTQLLEAAMEKMLSAPLREMYSETAMHLGKNYSISSVATEYSRLYNEVLASIQPNPDSLSKSSGEPGE